eukprot:scaffold88162_cov34-Prasinocladus_malaysianus.AAC.3
MSEACSRDWKPAGHPSPRYRGKLQSQSRRPKPSSTLMLYAAARERRAAFISSLPAPIGDTGETSASCCREALGHRP